MVAEFVNIVPSELTFPFELKKQISSSLRLFNTTNEYLAYKVKTTSPKKYCVRPNTGIILPNSNADILVIMQAQRDAPADMVCRDKFLVQSVIAPEGSQEVTQEMFNKEEGKEIQESKLRVVYVPPRPPSPVLEEGPEEGFPSPPDSVAKPASRNSGEVLDSPAEAVAAIQNINDVSVLRSKLEESLKNLSTLTQERNSIKKEKDHLHEELSKSKADLTSKISSAVNASREVSDSFLKTQTLAKKKSGWSTFVLLLIAILFFVFGYFAALSNTLRSQV